MSKNLAWYQNVQCLKSAKMGWQYFVYYKMESIYHFTFHLILFFGCSISPEKLYLYQNVICQPCRTVDVKTQYVHYFSINSENSLFWDKNQRCEQGHTDWGARQISNFSKKDWTKKIFHASRIVYTEFLSLNELFIDGIFQDSIFFTENSGCTIEFTVGLMPTFFNSDNFHV